MSKLKIPFLFLAIVLLSTTVNSCKQTKPQTKERPNVIIILADDLGYGDVGFHGC